ncbi:MAG TPA: CAP domain-containing protein [Woeseiaceae bacterium]|nr:CAP domain-containing protein [Woeseiaceae bacterium]
MKTYSTSFGPARAPVLGTFGAAIAVLAAPLALAADLVDVANIVRTRHCGAASLPDNPLVASKPLDSAAAAIADGTDVTAAIAAAGYRAKSSASIRVSTPRGKDDAVARELAAHFCHLVADPDFADIGVYRRGKDAWLLLAHGAPLPSPDDAALLDHVLEHLNAIRARGGRCGATEFPPGPPLARSPALDQAARAHAEDMARNSFLAHTGSDGSNPGERVSRAGYHWEAVAENVASGQTSADDVAATWLESPGHCENLMDAKYAETGIAYALNPGDGRDIYWVQVYAE